MTLIDNPDITGGGERMAVTIAMRLDPSRFERFLCATRDVPGPNLMDELVAEGVRVMSLGRRSKLALWSWWPLISLLRRERIDILHAHKFGSNFWGTIIGRATRIPVVVAHEQSWASAAFSTAGATFRRFMDREVIGRGVDAFFAVSRADRRRMVEVEGVDARRVCVMPNAIPRPEPSGRDVRGELGIPADAPVVVTVCQLRPEKALELLVDAAAILRDEIPAARVLIAGDGRERDRLRAQIDELGLEETVYLLGTRTDVPDLLAASDVAACCSDFEGTPLSIMEYMAAGKPVVGSRVGGIPELIDDGVHGLLFERRDARGFADALAALLRDPERRAQMGRAAHRRQRAEFDLDTTVRRLEELYELLYLHTERGRREQWTPQPRSIEGH